MDNIDLMKYWVKSSDGDYITMKILFGKNYQVGSMYNGSWRTVYNPTSFWEKYK